MRVHDPLAVSWWRINDLLTLLLTPKRALLSLSSRLVALAYAFFFSFHYGSKSLTIVLIELI